MRAMAPVLNLRWAVGKTTTSEEQQFFDNGDDMYRGNVPADTENMWDLLLQKMKEKNGGKNVFDETDLTIKAVQIYNRAFHGPAKHEYISVCAEGSKADFFFVIDRGAAKGSGVPGAGMLETQVHITYSGSTPFDPNKPDAHCANTDANWPENRSGADKGNLILTSHTVTSSKTSFKALIDAVRKYAKLFATYEFTNANCQHFATGLYNSLTNGTKEVTNDTLMWNLEDKKLKLNQLWGSKRRRRLRRHK